MFTSCVFINFFFVPVKAKSEVIPGYCVRISTGAPLPKGADAVVQVIKCYKLQ